MWRNSFRSVTAIPIGQSVEGCKRRAESRLRLVFMGNGAKSLSHHVEVLQADGGRIEHLGDRSLDVLLADRRFAANAIVVTAPRSARDLQEAMAASEVCAAAVISLRGYSDDRSQLEQLLPLRGGNITIIAPAGLLPQSVQWTNSTTGGADIGLTTRISGDSILIEWKIERGRDPVAEEFSLSGEAAALLEALDLMSARPNLAGVQIPSVGIARRVVRLAHRILARGIRILRSPNLSVAQMLVYAQAEIEMFIWRHARFLKRL
jgi:hypothetical protein